MKSRLKRSSEEYKRRKQTFKKRNRRFRVTSFFFILLMAAFVFCIYKSDDYINERAVTEIQNHELGIRDILDNPMVINNDEAISLYEEFNLGIPNNIALAGLSVSCDANTEYRNTCGELAVFRDSKTGKLVIEADDKKILDIVVGEIIVEEDSVFFINEENNSLQSFILSEDRQIDKKSIETIKENVRKFAVLGKYLIVNTFDDQLIKINTGNHKEDLITDNIQRFFVGGRIIAQTEGSILSMDYDGNIKSVVSESAVLEGYVDGKAYYVRVENNNPIVSENGFEVMSVDIYKNILPAIENTKKIARAVYPSKEGHIIDTVG